MIPAGEIIKIRIFRYCGTHVDFYPEEIEEWFSGNGQEPRWLKLHGSDTIYYPHSWVFIDEEGNPA